MANLGQLEGNTAELLEGQEAQTEDLILSRTLSAGNLCYIQYSAEAEGQNRIKINNV